VEIPEIRAVGYLDAATAALFDRIGAGQPEDDRKCAGLNSNGCTIGFELARFLTLEDPEIV
jgi:hypothetical protein